MEEVDWEKCIVCKQTTKEALQCPANSQRSDVGAGYETFANNINSFKQLGCMPVTMTVLASGTDSSLSELFKQHRANWHKKYKDKFNNTMLKRAQKRKSAKDSEPESLNKTTRLNISTTSSQSDIKWVFFCGNRKEAGELRKASTFKLDKQVRKCAQILEDT